MTVEQWVRRLNALARRMDEASLATPTLFDLEAVLTTEGPRRRG